MEFLLFSQGCQCRRLCMADHRHHEFTDGAMLHYSFRCLMKACPLVIVFLASFYWRFKLLFSVLHKERVSDIEF